MNPKSLAALLGVTSVLLIVQLAVTLFHDRPESTAHGQVVGEQAGRFILATGVDQGGNLPVVYIFDTQTQSLALYQGTKTGLELTGFRPLEWDLLLREEIPKAAQSKLFPVSKIKARVQAYRGSAATNSGSNAGKTP